MGFKRWAWWTVTQCGEGVRQAQLQNYTGGPRQLAGIASFQGGTVKMICVTFNRKSPLFPSKLNIA